MTIDTETLTRRATRLELDGIDFFARFADRPLDSSTLRCLQYMHDVENHTMCYLRDVLVTRAHRDPEVTAVLACWCYEEHWHGDALAQVLAAHGQPRAGRESPRCDANSLTKTYDNSLAINTLRAHNRTKDAAT